MPAFLRDRAFRPGLLPTLAMLPLLALLLWLGHWQWTRAAEKQALLDTWAARTAAPPVPLPMPLTLPATAAAAQRYLRVAVEGRYQPARQILLDNQTHEGRAGYHVLTPLVTAAGVWVMVDRGWVALPGNARERLPDVAVGAEPRTVTGRLEGFRRSGWALGTPAPAVVPDGQARVMNYPDAAAIAAALGHPVYPSVLRLDPGAPDALVVQDGPALEFGPERHLGYAIQWWALSLTLVLLWGWTALKPRRGNLPP